LALAALRSALLSPFVLGFTSICSCSVISAESRSPLKSSAGIGEPFLASIFISAYIPRTVIYGQVHKSEVNRCFKPRRPLYVPSCVGPKETKRGGDNTDDTIRASISAGERIHVHEI
jgi:hypothetical protein